MSLRRVIAFLVIAGGSVCGVTGTIVFNDIIAAVNEKLPPHEYFDYLFWGASKTQRLLKSYKSLYPEGKLVRRYYAVIAAMFLVLFLGFSVLVLFRR